MKNFVVSIASVLILAGAAWKPPALYGDTVEARLAEINKLSSDEREKRLVEEARKEGTALLYSSETIKNLSRYKEAFLKHYPFLAVNFWRAGGDRVATRVMSEYRAGKLAGDLLGLTVESVAVIDGAGVLARYDSPQRKFFPAAFLDRRSHYTPTYLLRTVMAYNTQLVKPEQAPKEFDDLLDPKWKGDITVDLEPTRALMGWIKAWGAEKAEKFLKDLNSNGAATNRGHTLQTQLVCAGQYKIAVELYAAHVVPVKRQGCPIAVVYANPVSISPAQSWAIPVTAPHPYTAALFLDFLLSEELAHLTAQHGYMPTRSGIHGDYEELAAFEKHKDKGVFISPEEAREMLETTNKIQEKVRAKN